MKVWEWKGKQAGVRPAVMVLGLAMLAFTAAGCMQSYGKLVSSPVIFDQYRGGALPDTFHYYFSGRPGLPDAVVGIDGNHRLKGRLWFRIDTMDQVYEKIRNLSELNPDATVMRTADILDQQGNRIGVWFSYFFYAPVKVDPDTGIVEIQDPGIFTGGAGRAAP